jgi:ribosomal protein S18 acetylase RimI-like enzyme
MKDLDFAGIARFVEHKHGVPLSKFVREAVPLADGWILFDGPGSPVNKVCGIGFDRPLTDAELDQIVTFFTERGAEPKVELSPFAPPELLAGLAKRGFVLREFENTLILDLQKSGDFRKALPGGWPTGVTIEQVDSTNDTAVREYVDVSFSGFFPEGAVLPDSLIEFGMKTAKAPGYELFVARAGREAVGAAGCQSSEGVTQMFGASVKAAHRRRGIQQALIAVRAERGRELGSHMAVIHSKPGIPTERNSARLGFQMAYVRAVLVKHGEGLVPSM